MRHPNPGETRRRHGLQDERQNLNRVHIAQIQSVDTEHGTASVIVNGTAQKYNVVIPTAGLSVQSNRSSWWRYMPQNNDFVKLGFGPDGRPEVLSMASWGNRYSVSDAANSGSAGQGPGHAPYIGGYAQIQSLANATKGGLRDFVPLRQGEWDFRSSGNAYIHGSDQGRLLLAGGTSQITLRKTTHEIESRTGLTITGDGEGTAVRLGDIKRKLSPTDFQETAITGSTKEYDLTVKTGGVVPLSMYQTRIGDVRDALGLPELAGGVPLRARTTCYDATGLGTALEATVDVNGNVSFTHGALAVTGLSLTGATGSLNTSYLNTTIASTVNSTVNAGAVSLLHGDVSAAVTGPLVQLGSQAALHPITRADLLVTATAPYTAGELAAWTTLAAVMTAFSAWLLSDNPITKGALQAAVGAAIPLMTAAGIATGAYAGTAATWVSPAVLTD